jgi:hypothetical protein
LTNLIGIVGPLGAGKTSAAKVLEQFGFRRFRMADTLKRMLLTAGLSYEQVDGGDKEVPADFLCGKTPRWAMQSLGTEWARECIGPDFWVNCMHAELIRAWREDPKAKIVIDDIRFENEVDLVRSFSGGLWRIEGREPPEKKKSILQRVSSVFTKGTQPHASEAAWKTFEVDYEINNTGSLSDLSFEVQSALMDDCIKGVPT